jgi:hypothetical protein
MERLIDILIDEKTNGANKYTIQLLHRAIDKKEKITFKDFIDSGMFVAGRKEPKFEALRYLGGFYITFDGVYKYVDGKLSYENESLNKVERFVWDNVADKKING